MQAASSTQDSRRQKVRATTLELMLVQLLTQVGGGNLHLLTVLGHSAPRDFKTLLPEQFFDLRIAQRAVGAWD